MAPDDLNLTVDFNDASFEDESSDPYIPETWASNRDSTRDSTGNNASMAVLGAGSEAAEFVFDFDDAGFDNDPDSDIGIESDMEGGSRVLRVDTSNDQGSFKFSSIPGDAHSVGSTPSSFYGNVEFSGNASLGVTDAFLANFNKDGFPFMLSSNLLSQIKTDLGESIWLSSSLPNILKSKFLDKKNCSKSFISSNDSLTIKIFSILQFPIIIHKLVEAKMLPT